MSSRTKNILIAAAIVVIAAAGCVSCISGKYNNLAALDEKVAAQWAQIENQYQRRYDLIPNLVSTVKGAAAHETEIFTQVAEARSKAGGVLHVDAGILDDEQKLAEFQKIQDTLGGALQRLLSVTESYPELRTNANFLALQDELEGTENRIAVARKNYNETAQAYNTAIRRFPDAMIASRFGFKAKAYFTATQEAQSAPKVEF